MAESVFCRKCKNKMRYEAIGIPHHSCKECDLVSIIDDKKRVFLKMSDHKTKLKFFDLMKTGKNIKFPRR